MKHKDSRNVRYAKNLINPINTKGENILYHWFRQVSGRQDILYHQDCIHLHHMDNVVVSLQQSEIDFFSLPPANEVWGKVMFLHLSVILFTRGGALPDRDPLDRDPLGQRPPSTETLPPAPRTETSLDRDPPSTETLPPPQGQRPPGQRPHWTEILP